MNDLIMRGSDLVGCPVVDVRTGEDVAEVRDIVFDSAGGLLTGFTLNNRGRLTGRLEAVLPIDRVSSVGTDAVMISGVDGIVASADGPDAVTLASESDEVVDDLVVTESGQTLGTVRDVIISGGATPRVVAFEIDGGKVGAGLIPASGHSGVSASALIVPDDFEGRIRNDLTGLAVELEALKEGEPS